MTRIVTGTGWKPYRLHINVTTNLWRNDCSLLISLTVPSRLLSRPGSHKNNPSVYHCCFIIIFLNIIIIYWRITAWKVSVLGVFLVHIFPHSEWIIQSECGEIRTRKTPNTGTFHAVKAGKHWNKWEHQHEMGWHIKNLTKHLKWSVL